MESFLAAAAVCGVLALLCTALLWMRRRGLAQFHLPGTPRARRMRTVERLPLGPQHSLHLVRLDGRALLVACSPSGCALIESGPWRDGAELQR